MRREWRNRHQEQGGYGIIGGIVGLIIGIVISTLLLRFVFKLIGLEPTNGLVAWIYNFTAPLISPFVNLINPSISLPTGQLEIDTIIAIVVYGVVGGIIERVLP